MIGKQKHKVYKSHAPHTNSKDTELQLIKAINMPQTMRFLLDNVYVDNPFQSQFGKLVNACPTLMQKFLGASTAAKVNPGNAETTGSLFTQVRTVGPLARISTAIREADFPMLKHRWKRVCNVTVLPSMKFLLGY